MRERLSYGRGDHDDHEENLDYDYGYQKDQVKENQPVIYDEFNDNYEEDHAEGSQEEVEHPAEYPPDDGAGFDYADIQFGWRSKARRGKRGRRWAPPDTRRFMAPVFVRLADPQSQDHS